MAQLLFSQLSQQVLGACFSVHNALGPGAGHALRLLLAHATGGWSRASLVARPCNRGLVTRFACCSPMQPGAGHALRLLLAHATGGWSRASLVARPCIRGCSNRLMRGHWLS